MVYLCRRKVEFFLGLTISSSMLVLLMFLRLHTAGRPNLHSENARRHATLKRAVKSQTKPPAHSSRQDTHDLLQPLIIDDRTYLLPLIEYNWNGPGWWMGQMRHATHLAMHFNRTIVTVPMKTHYRDTPSNYVVPFSSTFDERALNQVVPAVSLDHFRKVCGNHIFGDSLIIDPFRNTDPSKTREEFVKMYEHYRGVYEKHLGVLLPKSTSIPNSEKEYEERLQSARDLRCVAVYHPNKVKVEVKNLEVLQARAALGLAKAPYIREIVDRVEERMCGGEPFLVVHWRNKTGESCIMFKVCEGNMLEDVQTLIRLSPNISDVIIDYMKSMNLSCMYVAHPTFEQRILVDLKSKLSPERIITQADILKFKELDPYITNSYVISLIEQEISLRARVFLPWFTYGSWSAFVIREREAHGRLSKGLAYLPGMPKEARVYKWPY